MGQKEMKMCFLGSGMARVMAEVVFDVGAIYYSLWCRRVIGG